MKCSIKVTRHLCFKSSKILRPQDILAFNSANKPSFQNTTKSLFVGFLDHNNKRLREIRILCTTASLTAGQPF